MLSEHQPRVEDFDHTDPALIADPYPVYAALRLHCPVGRGSRFGGFWVLSRYHDVAAAAQDPATFCSSQGVSLPKLGSPFPLVPIEFDPPDHTRYRHLLQPLFTPGAARRLEPDVRALAQELIGRFADRGHADLARDIAAPLPPIVIARMLGLPEADWPWFVEMIERLLQTAKAEDLVTNLETALDFAGYLLEQLESRMKTPRDDMLSQLVAFEIDGKRLTDDELLGMTVLLVIAGYETTVGGIGMMLMNLGLNPGLKQQLVGQPSLIPLAVEEALRVGSPLQSLARTVTKDVEVRGQLFRAGDKVLLMWASANRDDEEFESPDWFVADRAPNRHLTFGAGPHRCLGSHLARLEMRVVLEEILQRIPAYRIDPDQIRMEGGINRLVTALPATWERPVSRERTGNG